MSLLLLSLLFAPAQTSVDDVARPVGGHDAPERAAETLGVLPLVVQGLQLNDAQRLNLGLRARLAQQSAFALQDQATSDLLVTSAQGLGLTCDVASTPCGVQLGQIVGVQHVLLGTAALIDDRVGLVIRLVNVEQEALAAEVSTLLPADSGAQMKVLNEIVAELLSPSSRLGALDLTVAPEGARVIVDGNPRGEAPLPGPVDTLLPGAHQVRIEKEGHLPFEVRVSVGAGETQPLNVTLAVDPNALTERGVSWFERAIPLSITGVGAAMLVGGLVAMIAGVVPAVLFLQEESALNAFTNDGRTPEAAAAAANEGYQRAEGWAQAWNSWGRVALGGGAAAVAAGVVTAGVGAGWAGYLLIADAE